MIHAKKPVTLAEVKEIVKDMDEKDELKAYLKKFTKLSKDKADKLAEDIKSLNNPKIREEDVVKLVDFMPEEKEDLNKVLAESSLSEEETNAILGVITKY